MEHRPESNVEIEDRDIFKVLNPYFLLFFGFSCILSSVFIQEFFSMIGQFRIGIGVAPVVGIILPIYVVARKSRAGFAEQLRIRIPKPRITLHVLVATLALVVIVDYIYVFAQRFMPVPTDYVESLKTLKPKDAISFGITLLGLCIIVPIAEEIAFRGIIQRVFSRNMNALLAVVLSGVFFGAIHFNPPLLLSMVCFGVFLGFVFYATSNLTYTVMSHAAFNAVAFVQLTGADEEGLTTAPFYLNTPWILVACLVMVAFLLRAIKKGVSPQQKTPYDPTDRFGAE